MWQIELGRRSLLGRQKIDLLSQYAHCGQIVASTVMHAKLSLGWIPPVDNNNYLRSAPSNPTRFVANSIGSMLQTGLLSRTSGRRGLSACLNCRFPPQTPARLFQCPPFPTSLTPTDLWNHLIPYRYCRTSGTVGLERLYIHKCL